MTDLITTDNLGIVLDNITDQIGITVAQMCEIYIRAQFIVGIVQIIMIVALCIISIVVFKFFLKQCAGAEDIFGNVDKVKNLFLAIVLAGLVIMLITFIMVCLYDPIIACLCPEYSAVKSLMHDIGDMVR